tara:strand:- start:2088 stop:2204 length:117 start_codon:yes stop_codon:yes gene_type:complete
MKVLLIILTVGILCSSCGVKERPEYKAQLKYKETISLT